MAVVELDAIPKLVECLRTGDLKLKEQSLWALGNIMGEGHKLRDTIIDLGAVPLITNLVTEDAPTYLLRTIAWVMSHFYRRRPSPKDAILKDVIPAFWIMLDCQDANVLFDTLWAISYIGDHGIDKLQVPINKLLLIRNMNLSKCF